MTHKCGAPNCPGHFSKTDRCPDFDIFRDTLKPPLFEPQKFYCGAPNCPGHFNKTDRCPDFDIFRDTLKPPLFEPQKFYKPEEPIVLQMFYCGAPNCPGHFNRNDKCLIIQPRDVWPPLSDMRPTDESQPSRIDQRRPELPPPEHSGISSTVIVIILLLLVIVYVLSTFGFESTLVAAEGFFIFAGWTGLRAASLSRKQESERLETFRSAMAIGCGVCCGLLAAYLLLTTSEGQSITKWVTTSTVRIIGSLFVSVVGSGFLELVWRAFFR